MKLFYRLFGYLLLGMIALISLDEYLSYRAEVDQFEADMVANAVQDGRSISGMIAHVWKESGEEKALELLKDASTPGTMEIHWVWVDALLDSLSNSPEEKSRLQGLADGEPISLKRKLLNDHSVLFTYYPMDIGRDQKGALELKQPLIALESYRDRMLNRALIITLFLALVCGTTLYVFINRKIRLPLQKLTRQAERIGRGDLSTEPAVAGDDELAELARTMNDMCSRLVIAKEKIKFEYDARLKTLEQLRHTERLSTFGLISAGIAHEIGTPLNVVDGRAKMILKDNLDSGEIKKCAAIIQGQAERMTVIVRQLLDFTRRPKRHIARENIAFLIKQVFQILHPMASKQHVSFSLSKTAESEAMLRVDGSQIQQVLVNLLMNSVQAMPDGGKVYVSLTNERASEKQAAKLGTDKIMKIQIIDEGEGILQENLEHIFTPFFTTKNIGTGTGLGLSIAHGIVEEHGGWIDVESTVQNGACFTIYLPMEEAK